MISENEMFWASVLGFLFVAVLIAFFHSLRKDDFPQVIVAVVMMAFLAIMWILNFTVGLA